MRPHQCGLTCFFSEYWKNEKILAFEWPCMTFLRLICDKTLKVEQKLPVAPKIHKKRQNPKKGAKKAPKSPKGPKNAKSAKFWLYKLTKAHLELWVCSQDARLTRDTDKYFTAQDLIKFHCKFAESLYWVRRPDTCALDICAWTLARRTFARWTLARWDICALGPVSYTHLTLPTTPYV